MRIGNGGARHVQRVNNLLKVGGRTIRGDLISENGEGLDEGRKAKRTAYLTKEINKSHDKRSGHMSINKRSETDPKRSKEEAIGNQSKNDQRKSNRKPIGTEPRSLFKEERITK